MPLKQTISDDIKNAMRAQDKVRLTVLRMVLSELKYAQSSVNIHEEIDDEAALKVVAAYHKKLAKSLDDYPAGAARDAIVGEMTIVEEYLPKRASAEEVTKVVDDVLKGTDDRQFGSLMKLVLSKLGGAADGKLVSQILKEKLA